MKTEVRTARPQATTMRSGLLQRKYACGQQAFTGGECQECKQKQSLLQRHTRGSSEPSSVPAIVHEILGLPGQPLDSSSRAFMEPRFGRDFSQVRVHTDGRAAESAQAVNALAYTVGRNVVFGAGQYAPQSPKGKHLLAHELTHVVQQASGTISGDAESRANSSADSVLLGKPVNQNKLGSAAVSLQKQEKTGETGLSSVHEDDPFLRALLRLFPQSNMFKKKPRNLFEPSWLQMPPPPKAKPKTENNKDFQDIFPADVPYKGIFPADVPFKVPSQYPYVPFYTGKETPLPFGATGIGQQGVGDPEKGFAQYEQQFTVKKQLNPSWAAILQLGMGMSGPNPPQAGFEFNINKTESPEEKRRKALLRAAGL